MCDCINVEIGSYDNQIILKVPNNIVLRYNNPDHKKINIVCVDKCVAEEIRHLWSLGIRTTGCCCGHNKHEGYIGVIDEDIPKMKDLGYKVHYNSCRPDDEDSFIPKSI